MENIDKIERLLELCLINVKGLKLPQSKVNVETRIEILKEDIKAIQDLIQ